MAPWNRSRPARHRSTTAGRASANMRELTKQRETLLAAAQVDPIGNDKTAGPSRSSSRAWQGEAYAYRRSVGEFHYATDFIGQCFSRVTLTIGYRDEDNNIGPAFDDEGEPITDSDGNVREGAERAKEALAYLRDLKTPRGGQATMMHLLGVNIATAGEANIVGSGDDNDRSYEVLSVKEFRVKDKATYQRIRYAGATPVDIPAEDVHVIRVYRPDPEYVDQADSGTVGALDTLELLALLTREIRGDIMSRISNAGMLIIPNEIKYGEIDPGEDEDEEGADPLTTDLIETMSAAIADKGSAAQTVPFIFRPPYDYADRIQHLKFEKPAASMDPTDKRVAAVMSLAQELDLPVEVVTGHASTTFANAVQIDDSLFKAHIEPGLELVVEAMTAGYLWPTMGTDPDPITGSPGEAYEGPLVVYYDSTELVSRPNRSADADAAYDRWAISWSSYRGAKGFAESDAPTDDELQRRLEIEQISKVRQSVAVTPAGLVGEDKAAADNVPQTPAAASALNPVPGGTPVATTPGGLLAQPGAVAAAAEFAVDRAIRRAGARLRSRAAKDPSTAALIRNVSDWDIGRTLGRVRSMSLVADPFNGEFSVFHQWLVRQGMEPGMADDTARVATEVATQRMYGG